MKLTVIFILTTIHGLALCSAFEAINNMKRELKRISEELDNIRRR